MAVAKKNKETKTFSATLTLEDGQDVHCELIENGLTAGDEERLAEAIDDMNVLQGRAEYLKRMAVEAQDEREHQKWLARYKDFGKKVKAIQEMRDFFIVKSIASWDLALTDEDEAADRFVPLTSKGLTELSDGIRWDLFNKVTEKLRGRSEDEKKGLFVNSSDDTQTSKASLAQSPDSTSGIN